MEVEALLKRAADSMKARDFEAAKKLTEEALQIKRDDPIIHLLHGNIRLRLNDIDGAITDFTASIRAGPKNPEAYNNLAVAYRQRGDLQNGLKALKKAHQLSPDRADICYNLANFLKSGGKLDEAKAWYERAIAKNPDFVLAYNNLGNLYEQLGDHARAAQLYRRGLQADEGNPSLSYNYGVTLAAMGDAPQAVQQYRRALKSRPNWTEGLNNLGIELQRTGDEDGSFKVFETILRVDPANTRARNNLAVLLTHQGELERAEVLLKEALQTDPEYTKAALNLGHLYEETGDYDKAESELLSLLEKDPKNMQARYQYACVLIQSHKLREASRQLKHLLKSNPDYTDALVAMGNLLLRAGKPDRAISYLDRALSQNPGQLDARIFKAQAFRDKGKIEQAIAELSAVLQVDRKHRDARLLLAELYLKNNLYEQARSILEELLMEYPANQDILSAAIRTYNAMGNQERAIQMAETLVNIQNERGRESDLDNLHDTLQLYEQVVNEYAQEYEEVWERNLNALVSTPEQSLEEGGRREEESLIFQGPAFEEETVPIIDIGGIEPVIVVDEEEETLFLEEMEEDILPPEDEEEVIPLFAAQAAQAAQAAPEQHSAQMQSPYGPAEERHNKSQASDYGEGAAGGPGDGSASAGRSRGRAGVPGRRNDPSSPEAAGHETEAAGGRPNGRPASAGGPAAPVHVQLSMPQSPIQVSIAPPREQPAAPSIPVEAGPHDENAIPPQKTPGNSPRAQSGKTTVKRTESAKLLDKFVELSEYIPEEKRGPFDASDLLLRMEALKAKLSGSRGIHTRIHHKEKSTVTVPLDAVASAFSYLEGLVKAYPNKRIGLALTAKITHIVNSIRRRPHG